MNATDLAAVARDRLKGEEAAVYLGLSRRTLEHMRSQGRGPRYMKIGGRCFYRRQDLEAYLAKTIVETSDTRTREPA